MTLDQLFRQQLIRENDPPTPVISISNIPPDALTANAFDYNMDYDVMTTPSICPDLGTPRMMNMETSPVSSASRKRYANSPNNTVKTVQKKQRPEVTPGPINRQHAQIRAIMPQMPEGIVSGSTVPSADNSGARTLLTPHIERVNILDEAENISPPQPTDEIVEPGNDATQPQDDEIDNISPHNVDMDAHDNNNSNSNNNALEDEVVNISPAQDNNEIHNDNNSDNNNILNTDRNIILENNSVHIDTNNNHNDSAYTYYLGQGHSFLLEQDPDHLNKEDGFLLWIEILIWIKLMMIYIMLVIL